jgi:hypothetical protein
MSTWFSKQLGDGIVAHTPSTEIAEAFRPLFAAAGRPADMAIFTRYDSEGHLQCEVTAYFAPAAAEVARLFDAEPCARPPRDGLGLLAGDQRCWSVLFPGSAK